MVIDKEYYEMIFKRKPFRRFNNTLRLSNDELRDINEKAKALVALHETAFVSYFIFRSYCQP